MDEATLSCLNHWDAIDLRKRDGIVDRIHEVSIECDFAIDGCDLRPRQDSDRPTNFDAKVFADANGQFSGSNRRYRHLSSLRENRGLLGVLIVDVSDKPAADRADRSEAAIGGPLVTTMLGAPVWVSATHVTRATFFDGL